MTYKKQQWKTGEIITEGKLNHIEDGIYNTDSDLTESKTLFASNILDLQTNKANQSDVVSINQELDNISADLAAAEADITTKAAQADVDTISDTVDTLQTQVTTNTNNIKSLQDNAVNKSELDAKQDKLTAGNNITIVDNVISATTSGGGDVPEVTGTKPITVTNNNISLSIGDGLSVTNDELVNLNPTPYTLPTATAYAIGGVKQGAYTSIDSDGSISVPKIDQLYNSINEKQDAFATISPLQLKRAENVPAKFGELIDNTYYTFQYEGISFELTDDTELFKINYNTSGKSFVLKYINSSHSISVPTRDNGSTELVEIPIEEEDFWAFTINLKLYYYNNYSAYIYISILDDRRSEIYDSGRIYTDELNDNITLTFDSYFIPTTNLLSFDSTSIDNQLDNKVDKVTGKSLIADTEITRLADVHNYDDTDVKNSISSLESTKQDKLTAGSNITIENNVISATGGSSTPDNMVTTDTNQTIKGNKTYTGTNLFNNGIQIRSSYAISDNVGTNFIIINSSTGLTLGSNLRPTEIRGSIIKNNGSYFLTQGNVTAGDNISIENTDTGIKISSTGGGVTPESYIIETYVNGTSGYRIWSPDSTGYRYCEQWGKLAATNKLSHVTFLKEFKDINYNASLTASWSESATGQNEGIRENTISTTGMDLCASYNLVTLWWKVSGYIKN